MAVTVFLYDGSTPYEITAEAFEVDLSRGRSRETDEFEPGGGTIRAHNVSRNFDPFFATVNFFLLQENGDFLLQESADKIILAGGAASLGGDYGAILQGRKVVVKDGATTVYTGFVEDYDYDWTPDGYAVATLTVRDALATLGRTTFLAHTATAGQYTGARITSVLDRSEVAFPGGGARSIDTGYVRCQGDSVSYGSNVLNYLQLVARTEFGRLFVDRSGVLTFLDRYAVFGATPSATFTDTGSGFPFSGIRVAYGSELLHFQVSVQREGGTTKTATNATAQAVNPSMGARHLSFSGLLFEADYYSNALATYLADRYSQNEAVVSGLDVPLGKLSTANRATVTALEIGDVITLTWTPTRAGTQVTQVLAIEGVSYTARRSGTRSTDAWISFQLSDARDPAFFVYDTDAYDGGKVYGF